MYLGAGIGVIFYLRIDTVLVFVVKTIAVLLLGHSVGMHRRLIHKSFSCPRWFESLLVYMGTLVGLGGPFTLIRTHDFRDWAQRQPVCHDYFAHRRSPLVDAVWQMHCDLRLQNSPKLEIEADVAKSRLYRAIDRHWIAVHVPWAIGFYLAGGWAWVLWGVCSQVAVTVTGHWLIGYMAHTDRAQDWHVRGAGVQGRNVNFAGLITMGESWHNNHHAFPGSARIGLYQGQSDPGYWLLSVLAEVGLVWDLRLPKHLPHRPNLHWAGAQVVVARTERRGCGFMARLGRLIRN